MLELGKILFMDIETIPLKYQYADLDEKSRKLWDSKWRNFKDVEVALQYAKAGIYAEFAKVICICAGYFSGKEFKLKAFYGEDEALVLREFKSALEKPHSDSGYILCAHNGKEFDFPFLCRRMLIQGISLPKVLQIQGRKPWEIPHLDTLEMWKFGDYKNYTSLDMLASVFEIPTPKDDMDGSQVARVYYEDKNLERIKEYCKLDVITVARVYQKMQAIEAVKDEQIIHLN